MKFAHFQISANGMVIKIENKSEFMSSPRRSAFRAPGHITGIITLRTPDIMSSTVTLIEQLD